MDITPSYTLYVFRAENGWMLGVPHPTDDGGNDGWVDYSVVECRDDLESVEFAFQSSAAADRDLLLLIGEVLGLGGSKYDAYRMRVTLQDRQGRYQGCVCGAFAEIPDEQDVQEDKEIS